MLIMAAPTGARRMKSDHPEIPLTIPETVATARECREAGADAFHLHIRNKDGAHSIDAGLYSEALAEIAQAVPEMPVQITTESGGIFDVTQQLATLRDLRPSWAFLCIREVARDEAIAPTIYDLCRAQGTKLQHILFDQ